VNGLLQSFEHARVNSLENRSMVRKLLPLLFVVLCALPAEATSRAFFGLVTKITTGRKGRVHVRVLWDSYARDYGGVIHLNVKKRWPGCVFRLDGKDSTEEEAIAVGRLLWCYQNRQSLRLVECFSVSDETRAKLEAEGSGALMLRMRDAVVWKQHRHGRMQRRAADLELGIRVDGSKALARTVSGARFNPVGFPLTGQDLRIDGERVRGTVSLRIPFKPRKRRKTPPPLSAQYTLDVPLRGGEAAFQGSCGELAVESKLTAEVKPQKLPERCHLWISIDPQAHQLTMPVVDGMPQQQNAFKLHSKGYIKSDVSAVAGSVTDEALQLRVTTGDGLYLLEGVVCGDRVMGTVTHGESSHQFYGGILPAELVPQGRIGHRDQDIPPRK
jgi:hypothetical protein